MAPSSVLLRRSVFQELGGFDPRLRRLEDWDLWLRLSDRYRVSLIPDVLVRRRAHPERSLAAEELPYRREMLRRLEPRIAALPEAERRRLTALHHMALGRQLARVGHRAAALRAFGRASRATPRSGEVYRGALGSLVVETAPWRAARSMKRRWRERAPRALEVRSW